MPKKPQHKKKPSSKIVVEEQEPNKIEEPDELDDQDGKKYKNRDIKSNWDKYKLDTSDGNVEDEEPPANDFDSLLKSTHTVTNAFKFKFERNWEKELEEQQPFQLNINLQALSAGLSCIPFYERIGLEPSEFSVEDLKKCDACADKCLKKYETTKETYFKFDEKTESSHRKFEDDVKSCKLQKQQSNVLHSSREGSENKSSVGNNNSSMEPILKFDDVEKMSENFKVVSVDSDLVGSHETVSVPEHKAVNDDENLEDWLDSVLDS